MPTRNRLRFLPTAIQCFRNQTYPLIRRELLIAEDGSESAKGILPDDLPIKLFTLAGRRWIIGAKRNFLCEQAGGEIIIHLDDDDWSAPERISSQVELLLRSGAQVCGYNHLEFRAENGERWLYLGRQDYALGTSLCYRRSWWQSHRFPPDQIGEDVTFVKRAARASVLVAEPAGQMMWARIHPGNTSPKGRNVTKGAQWRKLN